MKREKYEPVLKNISYFIKWAEGAIVIGIVSGCIGTAFGKCVLWVSAFFKATRGWSFCCRSAVFWFWAFTMCWERIITGAPIW